MAVMQDDVQRIHPGVLAAATAVGEALHVLARSRLAARSEAPDPFHGVLHLDDADVEQMLAHPPLSGIAPHAPFALPPGGERSPLDIVRAGLGLSRFETSVLALCLLTELDGRYAPLIGFLHDDVTRKQPSVELALTVFAPGGPARLDYLHAFEPGARLVAWQLIGLPQEEALIRQPLQLDRAILWFLLGKAGLDAGLGGVAGVLSEEHVVQAPVPPLLAAIMGDRNGAATPALLYGEDEQACLGAAAAAATLADRRLLVIDGERLAETDAAVSTLQRCLREAVLKGLLPCITHAPVLLKRASALAEPCRRCLMSSPLPALLISATGDGEIAYAGSGVVPVAVPAPPVDERVVRWRKASAAHGIRVDEATALALAETTGLSGSAIDEVATVAQVTAASDATRPGSEHLQRAARSILRQRARSLALVAPRYGWDDIVLPPDHLHMLRHLCSRVRYRSLVQQTWGMGHGTLPGVTAIFAGEPGTGKSMASEVIASDLGLDLCKIDLAQVVSKYIGETEKNLARIFDEAEGCGVVLLFDEADALFGKRSAVRDSHDRYANLETSYLLQRMERYRGLAILTTNLRANLDEAFTRRIGVTVNFPIPGPADRLRIWRRVLAAAPCDPQLNLADLAERLELAGGAIVNVAVTAGHLAAEEQGVIDHEKLLRAMRWELQKMGRLMGSEALDALMPVVAGAGRNGKGRR